MNVRFPDPPVLWEMGWGTALVQALTNAFQAPQLPQPLPRFTIATLPQAKPYAQCLAYVTDGADDRRVVVSDGSRWTYMDGEPA